MKKEDFVALGISEELAAKAAEKSAEELKGFVPRERLNEANTAKANAEKTLADVQKELDTLKESAGDNEALKKQVKDLQDDLKDKESKYADQVAEMRMNSAIQAAVGGSAQDPALIASLLDKSKLILGDDDKVTGLDEQIKSLRESKPFLFKDGGNYPDVTDGGEVTKTGDAKTRDKFAAWAAENFK